MKRNEEIYALTKQCVYKATPSYHKSTEGEAKKFKSKFPDGTQRPKAGFAIQKCIQTETAENKE